MNQEANPVEIHQTIVDSNQTNSIRTYTVFLDLPKHIEYRVVNLPLLQVNDVVEFDLKVKDPRNLEKVWKVNGPHYVLKRILKYCSDNSKLSGLTQYLEFKSVE